MISANRNDGNSLGKRASKMGLLFPNEEKEDGKKKFKKDISAIMGDVSSLNKNRIYNYGYVKKPAELFRKDLISAMKMADGEQLSREDYILITDSWKEEWEKGVQVPVNPESLPEPSYRCLKTEDDSSPQDTNKVKPVKKINESTETDLEVYGQYELDLLDLAWLQTLQESDESIRLPEKFVEDLINELEHQCARNMKAKQVGIEYDDHVLCDVCRSPDAEDGNEMVFCDSCNICVHQACYGITHIPDGEWLCRPCKELGYKKDLPCVLCPNTGGALKPTSQPGEWAHVACALWIPEVNIGCVKSMEPITKIKQISQTRLNLVCSICKIKKGAPIQCSINSCKIAYHVTCAFNAKLKMNVMAVDDRKGVKLRSYCSKHSNKNGSKDNENADSSSEALKDEKSESDIILNESESDDPCNEFWKYIDITQINHEFLPMLMSEFPQASKDVLGLYIDLVLQYWKMKRVSNYGSPLIRMINATSLERLKLQQHAGILRFRVDLERIRNLSYMLCRREKIKCNWVKTHQSAIEQAIAFATGSPLPNSDEQSGATSTSPSFKTNSTPEERLKLAKEIINTSVIYDDWDTRDKNKPKVLIKQLKNMMRNDSIEKLRRHRPNPYLKFYPQRRSESSDNGNNGNNGKTPQSPQQQHHQKAKNGKGFFNGSHTKNHVGQTNVNGSPISASLPLRNKSVPANQTSPKSESIGNTLREKSITKSDKNNQISLNSKPSPESIKEDKIVNNSVITRASALIGYRIPKKKNRDNHKDDDRICLDETNYAISPLKNYQNDQRVTVSNNHHFLRRPTMEDNYKGNERFLERRRSFNQRRF